MYRERQAGVGRSVLAGGVIQSFGRCLPRQMLTGVVRTQLRTCDERANGREYTLRGAHFVDGRGLVYSQSPQRRHHQLRRNPSQSTRRCSADSFSLRGATIN